MTNLSLPIPDPPKHAEATRGDIVRLESIGKSFPGVRALSNVSLGIELGELHAICGENGAGKSTLMKILSGVIRQYDGRLVIDGNPVEFKSTRDAERAGISIIHQELNIVDKLSVAANIFLGRERRSLYCFLNERSMDEVSKSLLRELECHVDPRVTAGSLRVGDQQLVEIAKALSLDSRILIMDEPTSALTEGEVERLYRVIAKLRQRGKTILYISHKMDEVFHLADRISVLRDGTLIKTLRRDETNPAQITELMVGRALNDIQLQESKPSEELVLKVRNLNLAWPGHARGYRLKDISFDLRRGEILGIAGLMGAGRTELLECLFGASAMRPSGTMELFGKPYAPRHPKTAYERGVALVTEDRKRLGIFPAMNVGKNMAMSQLRAFRRMGFLSGAKEHDACTAIANNLQVKTPGLWAAITGLSGGNQQKCIVGRWLLTNPKILLLDDPTRGVDVGAKAELYAIIKSLCREGLSVIVTSSELPELLTLSDRILVLSEGRITASMERSEATQAKIMAAATL